MCWFLCNALSYACRQYENFEILYFTMRNTSMLMKSTRKACRNAPFWNNAGKLHRQYLFSSFKAEQPAIYKTVRICRHSRQAVVSNPSATTDGGKLIPICQSQGKHADVLSSKKRKNAKAKKKFSLRNEAPFWRERVDHLVYQMVDS